MVRKPAFWTSVVIGLTLLGVLHTVLVTPDAAEVQIQRYVGRFALYGAALLAAIVAMWLFRGSLHGAEWAALITLSVSAFLVVTVSFLELGWRNNVPAGTLRAWLYDTLAAPAFYGGLYGFFLSAVGVVGLGAIRVRTFAGRRARVSPGEYHAFLSYSQKDSGDVDLLHEFLYNFWIPGRPRRRIFRDEDSLLAGRLNPAIQDAIEKSHWFILCWSEAARDSKWVVPAELACFLKRPNALERILVCRVGDETSAPGLPSELSHMAEEADDPALLVNLREWHSKPGDRNLERRAFALLASILHFERKDYDAVMLSRRLSIATLAGLVVIVIVGAAMVLLERFGA